MVPLYQKGDGGISNSLFDLAQRQGVKFPSIKKWRKLTEKDRVKGVLVGGQKHFADCVVSNMDIYPTYRKLLPQAKAPEKTLKQERSSFRNFYWGIKNLSQH